MFGQNIGIPIINSASGMIGQWMANRANKKLLNKQLDWNEAMWHQQNAYNTPTAQMQRLREAGLNPNMILGGIDSGQAGGVNSVSPPDMKNIMADFNPMEAYLRMKQITAGIENIEAETELKIQQKDIQALEAGGLEIRNMSDYLRYQRQIETYGSDVAGDKARNNLSIIEQTIRNQQIELNNQAVTFNWIRQNQELINLMYLDFEKAIQMAQSEADLEGTKLDNMIKQRDIDYYKKTGMLLGNKPIYQLFGEYIAGLANIKGNTQGVIEKIENTVSYNKSAERKLKSGKYRVGEHGELIPNK